MAKVQKTYPQEFKRKAVLLAQSSGKPIAQVALELGISDSSIHQWRKELADHGAEAFPGSGPWRKKIAVSNESWREDARNAIY